MENLHNTQATNTETQENNKIIAEFMGVKPRLISPDVYGYSDSPFFNCIHDTPEKVIESISKYVKYHSDWNWLMPVIQEIGNRTGYELCMHLEYSYWNNSGNDATGSEYGGYENIASIHYAVVSFIKWYNENK